MAFTRQLKQMMIFIDGVGYSGEVVSITPPKLIRKMEDYRGGGMGRPVKIDMGGEPLEMEATYGGPMRAILNMYGQLSVGATQQRFVGSFQNDHDGTFENIEIVTRGRHEEIDLGEWKPGEVSEFTVKSALSYYKMLVNGVRVHEIDPVNMVEIVNGVDLMAPHRAAFGLI